MPWVTSTVSVYDLHHRIKSSSFFAGVEFPHETKYFSYLSPVLVEHFLCFGTSEGCKLCICAVIPSASVFFPDVFIYIFSSTLDILFIVKFLFQSRLVSRLYSHEDIELVLQMYVKGHDIKFMVDFKPWPWPNKIVQVSPLSLVENRQIHRVNVRGHLTKQVCLDDKILS